MHDGLKQRLNLSAKQQQKRFSSSRAPKTLCCLDIWFSLSTSNSSMGEQPFVEVAGLGSPHAQKPGPCSGTNAKEF